MLLLIRHPGLARASLWSVLEGRWPDTMPADPGCVESTPAVTVEAAAALARRRRGIEPVRIVIMPHVLAPAARQDHWDEPTQMLF